MSAAALRVLAARGSDARRAAAPVSAEEAAHRFAGAPRPIVERDLETLAIPGELQPVGDARHGVAVH